MKGTDGGKTRKPSRRSKHAGGSSPSKDQVSGAPLTKKRKTGTGKEILRREDKKPLTHSMTGRERGRKQEQQRRMRKRATEEKYRD